MGVFCKHISRPKNKANFCDRHMITLLNIYDDGDEDDDDKDGEADMH